MMIHWDVLQDFGRDWSVIIKASLTIQAHAGTRIKYKEAAGSVHSWFVEAHNPNGTLTVDRLGEGSMPVAVKSRSYWWEENLICESGTGRWMVQGHCDGGIPLRTGQNPACFVAWLSIIHVFLLYLKLLRFARLPMVRLPKLLSPTLFLLAIPR